MKERTPQLVLVLETFAPVHQSLPAMLVIHFFYWYVVTCSSKQSHSVPCRVAELRDRWSAPWYLHFLLPYPIIYLVPMWCTVVSLLRWEDQELWSVPQLTLPSQSGGAPDRQASVLGNHGRR